MSIKHLTKQEIAALLATGKITQIEAIRGEVKGNTKTYFTWR